MTTESAPAILLDLYEDDGYAVITYNRPEKRNALNGDLMYGMLRMLDELRVNDKIGVVITRGAGGKSYSAGGDLPFMRAYGGQYKSWDDASLIFEIMQRIRNHPKVFIACVEGWCVGGGLAFVMAQELAVCGEGSLFSMPEIIFGSFGQYLTTALFHAGIPTKKAFLLQMTGRKLTAAEAENIGLVSLVVPDAEVWDRTVALAKEIAGHNHRALEHGKLAAYMGMDLDYTNSGKVDWLCGGRLRLFNDPMGHVNEYLDAQKGGGDVNYRRPDQRGE